jgi:rSAM/selenodomain-associated transferase 1
MTKQNKSLIIIFVKNPQLGKVKTRLAATIGAEAALEVYIKLVEHTNAITATLPIDKIVYYSDFMDDYDLFENHLYQKSVQEGVDLGVRMDRAFDASFASGYEKVAIIGSDCYELTREIILDAFNKLGDSQAVVGPAKDGGYYLLGMTAMYSRLFRGKKWSTSDVMLDTLLDLKKMDIKYRLLPTLSDVDFEEDLGSLRPGF